MIVNFLKQSEITKKLLLNINSELTEDNIFSYSTKELEDILSDTINSDSFNLSIQSEYIAFEDGEFTYTKEQEENDSQMINILNDFLKMDKVKDVVDTNKDGKLSNKEINEFLEAIEALDKDAENISMNDIFSAMQSIEEGSFNDILEKISTETNPTEDIKQNNAKRSSNSGGKNYHKNAIDNQDSTKPEYSKDNLSSMSLEQLEAQKNEQESELKTAQDNVTKAYNGETDAIKRAQEDCDTKKQAYEQALKNDENISNELKAEQQENQTNIDNQKAVIDSIKSNINSKENEITAQESTITADKSNISAYESAISNLKSQKSDDADVQSDIAKKLSQAEKNLKTAKEKLSKDEKTLKRLNNEKGALETNLETEEGTLQTFENEKKTIEANIIANCGDETKAALDAFKAAEENVETVKADEIAAATKKVTEAQTKLDEINAVINTKNANKIEKEFSVNSLSNPEQLYKTMGLEEKGLNYEVFMKAIEGYNNIEDKGNGFLGIFDTTQGDDAERYYLLDLNNFELVGQSVIKTGSGNMDDVQSANKHGSKATLSGFERIREEYNSSKKWKIGIRLDGIEAGINDNSYAKAAVAHYTTGNSTWGCKGIAPVYKNNGKVDEAATFEKLRTLFPTGGIIFTYPTDEDYWELSNLY